eukprot:scaffold3713_cov372-Prasinococcus_capsulatus_cf.AAC.31
MAPAPAPVVARAALEAGRAGTSGSEWRFGSQELRVRVNNRSSANAQLRTEMKAVGTDAYVGCPAHRPLSLASSLLVCRGETRRGSFALPVPPTPRKTLSARRASRLRACFAGIYNGSYRCYLVDRAGSTPRGATLDRKGSGTGPGLARHSHPLRASDCNGAEVKGQLCSAVTPALASL